jgi:hypothetical protein
MKSIDIRASARRKVVYGQGMLGVGSSLFFVTNVFYFSRNPTELHERGEFLWFLLSLAFFGMVGYAFGLFLWKLHAQKR